MTGLCQSAALVYSSGAYYSIGIMGIQGKRGLILFLLGDVILLTVSLWITLAVRYFELPSLDMFFIHLVPFGIIIVIWVLVFFIFDLYKTQTSIMRRELPSRVVRAQAVNTILAIFFFYFVPYFDITPKTNLFIYLFISSSFILLWRFLFEPVVHVGKKGKAVIVGSGDEVAQLAHEINHNTRYRMSVVVVPSLSPEEVFEVVKRERADTIIVNLRKEGSGDFAAKLYNLLFLRVRFIELHTLYEDIFERVPLSLLEDNWFLENISAHPKRLYDSVKRLMDVVIGVVLGMISLFFYPLVIAAIKFESKGNAFTLQRRVGEGHRAFTLLKFRTMMRDDGGHWGKGERNEVTRVGKFLRRSRIDELPQLWNVVRGDISLIGPRPEFPEAVRFYHAHIPYYGIRHLIKPGLSGWAQIYHTEAPHHGTDIAQTKIKLSYDLYYLKNRSILTDIIIALKTLRTLFSRSGV